MGKMIDRKKLDATDYRILCALVEDARITNKELAEKVSLSPSPCWERVRRLEEDGYITGYSANLGRDLLGAPDTVFVEIQMENHDGNTPEEIGSQLAALDEVLEIYLKTGGFDFFIKVAVDGGEGFEQFIRGRLSKITGIKATRSSFALKCLKRVQAHIPL